MNDIIRLIGFTIRLLLLMIIISSSSIDTDKRAEVDYNPKLLQKEVVRIFRKENIEIRELGISGIYEEVSGMFFKLQSADSMLGYAYIGRVNSCRAGGCEVPRLLVAGEESEYFDYFILYDTRKQVLTVRVFNYQASHGQEVTSRGWLRQFISYDGTQELEVGKQVDAISGATISVNGLVEDIKEKTKILKAL